MPVYINCLVDIFKMHILWAKDNVFLTYDSMRIVDDARFSVVRDTSKDWNLRIQNVIERDTGTYVCQSSPDNAIKRVRLTVIEG